MNKFTFIGMLMVLFSLFGCIEKSENKVEKVSNVSDEELLKSIQDFKNRPMYKDLTEQIIDKTSDDKLLEIVCDNLIEKQPEEYNKEFETVMSWNESQQAIYLIMLLEGEVNNGGFNQFYSNSSGQYNKYLPKALNLVEAKKFAELTSEANNTFENENKKISKDQDGTLEGFSKSYKDNPLNNYDDKFYDLYKFENLHGMQVNYIRKHKKDFIDN